MFKVYKKEIEVAGKKISLETGKVARQADGAIVATCGETVVLATVVGAKKVNPDMDYFPLSVNYQEKYYAAVFSYIGLLSPNISLIPRGDKSKFSWIFSTTNLFLSKSLSKRST